MQHRGGELAAGDLRLAQLAFERGAAGEEFVHFGDDAFLWLSSDWRENCHIDSRIEREYGGLFSVPRANSR